MSEATQFHRAISCLPMSYLSVLPFSTLGLCSSKKTSRLHMLLKHQSSVHLCLQQTIQWTPIMAVAVLSAGDATVSNTQTWSLPSWSSQSSGKSRCWSNKHRNGYEMDQKLEKALCREEIWFDTQGVADGFQGMCLDSKEWIGVDA